MNIYCIHCGKSFSIQADQLGKRGKCPHCKSTVVLPKSKLQYGAKERHLDPPSRWMESTLCGLGAVIAHLLTLLTLTLVPWGDFSDGEVGDGEQILIGELSREQLVETVTEKLQNVEIESPSETQATDALQAEMFSPLSDSPLSVEEFDLTIGSPATSGSLSFEIQSLNQESVLAGGSEDFGKMISRLQRQGLDIVIVFDSSGSMQGEINEIKNKIQRIGSALYELIPATRISVSTYRDHGDEYVVKGLPLTSKLGEVIDYLEPIEAGGGGDKPESVDEGLNWAVSKNSFRRSARKVILLFGDAPPHQSKTVICQQIASDFRHKQRGVVSTVTCRSDQLLPDFVSISQIGGGESFLTSNEREIMTQLMILVFGSQHRRKVVEAFDLMGQ
jgi:DNA-directed RNA polymerase subunit RPC12/RpoP